MSRRAGCPGAGAGRPRRAVRSWPHVTTSEWSRHPPIGGCQRHPAGGARNIRATDASASERVHDGQELDGHDTRAKEETKEMRTHMFDREHSDTGIVGAGQAGLATGYYLAIQGHNFLIVDGHERIGEAWRRRWDSLRLFTPAAYDGLPGMPFPAPPHAYPTKDEMAAYLEAYAARFALPLRLRTVVNRLVRQGSGYMLSASSWCDRADQVVVATGGFHHPRIPAVASALDPKILQLHSVQYRDPRQLQDGPVLIVGAGNSGAEIAMDVAARHQTWLSGHDTGRLPLALRG